MSTTTVRRRGQRRSLVAGLLAAALALGGSTFALWSAQGTFTGGTITAGDLNLEACGGPVFYDVSQDRVDATTTVDGTDGSQPGHLIVDDTTWRTAPGDKTAVAFCLDVTLEGDNMIGKLSLGGVPLVSANAWMDYSYELYREGKLLVAERPLSPSQSSGDIVLEAEVGDVLYLAAPENGQAAGLPDAEDVTPVRDMASTTERFALVVYASFDAATPDREAVTVSDTLGSTTVDLEQVRCSGQFTVGCEGEEPGLFIATMTGTGNNIVYLDGVGAETTISWCQDDLSSCPVVQPAQNGGNSAPSMYGRAPRFKVKIDGTFDRLGTEGGASASSGDYRLQITRAWLSVDVWTEATQTKSTRYAFAGATELSSVAKPPSTVEDMSYMFSGISTSTGQLAGLKFNQDIGDWDVSNVKNMQQMFQGSIFNQDIGDWDVSSVQNMSWMFWASSFNQDIGSWDVGNVETMQMMFRDSKFDNGGSGSIGGWDTSEVRNMENMFYGSIAFSQDISCWDVSSVDKPFVVTGNPLFPLQKQPSWGTSGCHPPHGPARPMTVLTVDPSAPGCVTPGVFVAGGDVQSGNVQLRTTIRWGDGTATFATSGMNLKPEGYVDRTKTYQITIEGTYTQLGDSGYASVYEGQQQKCYVSVDRWDPDAGTATLNSAFRTAVNLISVVQPPPTVVGMNAMFMGATGLADPSIERWDVSKVTNFGSMFRDTGPVYLDLRCWDVSAVSTASFFSTGNTGGLKEPIWGGTPVCS